MLDLSLAINIGTRIGGFSPATLFAASEPGGWYDPSDLSTLFQDSAGTTPVTTAGQSVGLWLDKSQGLVLGPELVTNGDFSAGTTGWGVGTGWTVSGGIASFNNPTGSNLSRTDLPSIPAGRLCKLEIDLNYTSGAGCAVGLNIGGGIDTFGTFTGSGRKTAYVITTTARTGVQVTGIGGSVFSIDNISVRELPGNHLSQSTLSNRPMYQVDGNGRGYLQFDGSDDWLVSPTITPGIDKAQVFAGVRKLSDVAASCVAELSANLNSNNGTFAFFAPEQTGASGDYTFASRGSVVSSGVRAFSPVILAPNTSVISATGDISADLNTIRINGVSGTSGTADQGTGNYLAYPLYVGRRGGTTNPFNGRIYSLIVRFGANLSASTITQTENWVAGKTGITI